MKKFTIFGGKLALAATLLLGINGVASATIIDTFETAQAQITRTTAGTTTTSQSGTGILGGWRDISLTIPAADGPAPTNAARVEVAGGVLNVGNDPFVTSVVEIAWDGQGVGGAATGLGLDGDLSSAIAILVEVLFADQSVTIEFDLTDVDGGFSTASKTASTGVVTFGTADFGPVGMGASADWSKLKSIVMRIEGPAAYDIVIDIVETEIPEPSTMLLSGAALLALGLLRKRLGAKA